MIAPIFCRTIAQKVPRIVMHATTGRRRWVAPDQFLKFPVRSWPAKGMYHIGPAATWTARQVADWFCALLSTMAKKSSPVLSGWSPRIRWLRSMSWTILTVCAGVAAAHGLQIGHSAWQQTVAALPGNRLPICESVISGSPNWITVDVPKSTLLAAGLWDRSILLTNASMLAVIGRAIESSPWVRRVHIRRSFQNLSIDVEYRKPVLAVPWQSKFCYVDQDGIVLPAVQASDDSLRRCLVLLGADSPLLPQVGARFSDRRVADAAKLALRLDEVRSVLPLTTIAVRSAAGEPFTADLFTYNGSRVAWHPTDEDGTGRRIDALCEFARQHGADRDREGPAQYHFDDRTGGWLMRESPSAAAQQGAATRRRNGQ